MKLAKLDTSSYVIREQFDKVREEYSEAVTEMDRYYLYKDNKAALCSELIDLIQASMTALQMVQAGTKEFYAHILKMRLYEQQGKIKSVGEYRISEVDYVRHK